MKGVMMIHVYPGIMFPHISLEMYVLFLLTLASYIYKYVGVQNIGVTKTKYFVRHTSNLS